MSASLGILPDARKTPPNGSKKSGSAFAPRALRGFPSVCRGNGKGETIIRNPTVALALAVVALLCMARGASAATITVTGTGDTIAVDGVVTLREAITSINNAANLNADVVAVGAYGTSDTINFNISGAGVHTIALTAVLPAIVKPVTIDGYTQPRN